MTEHELIIELTDALQETRQLAAVSYEGDPWFAESDGLDAIGILSRARGTLEIAEAYRDNPAQALEDNLSREDAQ